jgi:hypothetical protein
MRRTYYRKCKGGGVPDTFPAFTLRKQAQWLALSAIEAFFSRIHNGGAPHLGPGLWNASKFPECRIISIKFPINENRVGLITREWRGMPACAASIRTGSVTEERAQYTDLNPPLP